MKPCPLCNTPIETKYTYCHLCAKKPKPNLWAPPDTPTTTNLPKPTWKKQPPRATTRFYKP